MPVKKPRSFRKTDYFLLGLVIILSGIGMIMVFSSAATESLKAGDPFYFLKKQLVYLAVGFFALYLGARIEYSNYRKWAGWLLLVSAVLLTIVFAPFVGRSAGGASRWIDLGFFSFQPGEFAKLAIVIYLADAITKKGKTIKSFFQGILPLLGVVCFFCLLVLKQPDLGTVLVIFGTAVVMLFIGGAKPIHMVLVIAGSIAAFLVLSIVSPYRRRRLLAYIDPWKDPQGIGFHIIQSLIAVGSGGIFGLGLGESRQKLLYLPEQYTDFIFAVLCEEVGFIGAVFVIILFIGLVARGLYIARRSFDEFGTLLAVGISSYIALQVLINIGVVVGIVPTTGIPLPFISYGGTSLVVALYSVGILLNISNRRKNI